MADDEQPKTNPDEPRKATPVGPRGTGGENGVDE